MLKTAKVVGLNSDIEAALALISQSQAISLSEDNLPQDSSATNVRLFAIVSCELEDAFSRTRQALSEAETVFYSSPQSISHRLSETLETIKHSLDDAENFQVILAATQQDFSETALYLLCQGTSLQAYLIRNSKQTSLCNITQNDQLVSGILQAGDRVVLTTASLNDFLKDDLDKVINLPIESLEDEIALRLPQAHICPLAAIFLEEESLPEEVKEESVVAIEKEESSQRLPSLNMRPVFDIVTNAQIKKILPVSPKAKMILGGAVLVLVLGGIGYKTQLERFQVSQSNLNNSQSQYSSNQLPAVSPEVSESYQVADFPLWLDLDLVKKDFNPKNLSLSHGKILVLDTNTHSLVKIDLQTKAPDILAGEDKLGSAVTSSLNGDVAWVFSKDKGLIRVDTGSNGLAVASKTDSDWGNIADIYGFAGNAYILDEFKNQIWKYVPIVSGFADKREYLRPGTKADFAGVRRLQIDSSVWVLKRNEILKYTQGAPDFFSLSGLDKPIKEPKSLFVSDQTDNLYLLDSGNNRLLVLDKKGIYIAQYQADQMNSFSDLAVDETNKKVYLLAGSKIFQMDLR